MRQIGDIHTFEDTGLQRWMVRASGYVALAAAAGLVAWAAASALGAVPGPAAEFAAGFDSFAHGMAWVGCLAAGCLLALPVHELAHGAFFKLLAPAGATVSFGANWKLGMLYACAEGIVYSRRRYLAVLLAPTVLVSAAALAAGAATGFPLWGYLVAAVHLTGCTGDWSYARAILRDPRIAYCEDTVWGVRFYAEETSRDDSPPAPKRLEKERP